MNNPPKVLIEYRMLAGSKLTSVKMAHNCTFASEEAVSSTNGMYMAHSGLKRRNNVF
jgi:hypothetical protein